MSDKSGKLRLFDGTPDAVSIDPNSRALVTLPAYRVAQLAETPPETTQPIWDPAVVRRALARYVRGTPEASAIKTKPTLSEWESAVRYALDDGVDLSRAAGARNVVRRAQRLHLAHVNARRRTKCERKTDG